MNSEKKTYFVLILVITALIFKQHWGLNALLISILSVSYLFIFNDTTKNKTWWISACLWIGSGLSIFLSSTFTGSTLYILTFLNFMAINANQKYSFPFTLVHTLFSFFIGIARFFTPKPKQEVNLQSENWEQKQENLNAKFIKKIFLYGIPVLLVIVFLKLYQLANPTFAEYTAFLNFKFINWQFILLYAVLMLFMYGFYLFNTYEITSTWDISNSNRINADYSDSIQKKIGIDTEQKMAVMTLVTLNILLIAFTTIDGITLFSTTIDSELTHSETVHQGINVLITSIVLVILCIGFIFRGALNFTASKTIKLLTSFWLVLNVVITVFNSIKNFNYISEWGLTHKRIGVYTYLALCVLGLGFTLYKVWKQKSFTFLIRRVSFSFAGFLVLFSLINWNSIISNYNLDDTKFSESTIDFQYNLDLGFEAYPALVKYYDKHPKANIEVFKELDYKIRNHTPSMNSSWQNFPSLKWSEYLVEKELQNYTPMLDNDYEPYNRWFDSF